MKKKSKAKGISKEEIITLFMLAFHSILSRNHKIRVAFFRGRMGKHLKMLDSYSGGKIRKNSDEWTWVEKDVRL